MAKAVWFKEVAFEKLLEQLDEKWIDEALEMTGTATMRRRRLHAEQVIWQVLPSCIGS